MNYEKFVKLAAYIIGISGGFLLRGNVYRGDEIAGYASSILLISVGLMFLFTKKRK